MTSTKKYVIGRVRAPIRRAWREHTDCGMIYPKMTISAEGSARLSKAPAVPDPKMYVQIGSVRTESITFTTVLPIKRVHNSMLPLPGQPA